MSNDKLSPGDRVVVFSYGGGPLKGYIKEVHIDRAVVWFGNGFATVSISSICHARPISHKTDPVVEIIEDIKEQNKWVLNGKSPEEAVSD